MSEVTYKGIIYQLQPNMICIIKICCGKYCQIVSGGIRGTNHSCYISDMLACKGTACHYYLMATHHAFVILVKTIQKK